MSVDYTRHCRECDKDFTWTAAQADWSRRRFEQAGMPVFEPNICFRCRAEKRVALETDWRIAECCACGIPFPCPPWLKRLPVYCRVCMEEARRETVI